MRPFNALSLGIGLALACFEITTVRAELRIDETFDKSEPWIIGYNSSLKGCVASAMSDDRTTVWIGYDGTDSDIPAYLAFTNPNWHSIEPRKFYELQIQTSGSQGWRGYGNGVARPNKGFFVFGVQRRFLQDFAQASGLVLLLNKEVLTRANISGSSDALEKLMSCQRQQIIASKNQGIEGARLVAETQAREKESREQAEREGVASDQRDAVEQEKEPNKAAQQPAPSLSDNRVATLPAPVDQPPADPGLKGGALVRAIKQELKRVGCYDGRLDEDWQTAPARASIQKFARLARLTISPVEPTNELLDAILARSERVCPFECGRRQIEKDGRCIAKSCPSGFALDDDGACIFRRRTATRHEIDQDKDRPRVRSHEIKRRARADSAWDPHDGRRVVTPGGPDMCGPNGCKKVPIGCRVVRPPDGGNRTGGKIFCP
jgi:hypothetical protein